MYIIFRSGFNKLAVAAVAAKQARWHMRPKQHQLEHLTCDFLPRNPRYYHNFLSEDYVRRAKQLAVRSHPNWMARHVLFRYCVQFCIAWRENDLCEQTCLRTHFQAHVHALNEKSSLTYKISDGHSSCMTIFGGISIRLSELYMVVGNSEIRVCLWNCFCIRVRLWISLVGCVSDFPASSYTVLS